MIEWSRSKKKNLFITFLPFFYETTFLKLLIDQWLEVGFSTNYIDVNAHYILTSEILFDEIIERNARKNLKNALKYDFTFSLADSDNDKRKVYSIIQQNRIEKGFPLRMTFDDLAKTNTIVPIDYFLLEMDSKPCAAAVVFSISESTAMVVYWGNLNACAEMRPMNLLPKLLFEYYEQHGKQFLDIGPSSENGIVNEGLAAFKKSIGCVTTEKYSLKFIYA